MLVKLIPVTMCHKYELYRTVGHGSIKKGIVTLFLKYPNLKMICQTSRVTHGRSKGDSLAQPLISTSGLRPRNTNLRRSRINAILQTVCKISHKSYTCFRCYASLMPYCTLPCATVSPMQLCTHICVDIRYWSLVQLCLFSSEVREKYPKYSSVSL